MQRRSFLTALAGASAAVALNASSALAKVKKPVKKPANSIGKVTAFAVGKPVAMTATYKGAQRRFIVHRTSASAFVVLDSTCTHQGCQIRIADAFGPHVAQCPCHLAQFDLTTGTNTMAPSGSDQVQPLRRFSTAVKNGYLVFTS